MEKKIDFTQIHIGEGYESDDRPKRSLFEGLPTRPRVPTTLPNAASFANARSSSLRSTHGAVWHSLNAFQRHQKLVSDYINFYGGSMQDFAQPESKGITDADILRKNYRFVRDESDNDETNWEKRVAKRYYDKLFKEYCLADFSFYKEGKVGLRWRVKSEVISGKGQFECGNKKCVSRDDLKSYEVNFGYREAGVDKQALVKLRLCSACGYKLNYKKIQKIKDEARKAKKKKKKKNTANKKKKKKHQKAPCEQVCVKYCVCLCFRLTP
jgi:protein FRA10AC1